MEQAAPATVADAHYQNAQDGLSHGPVHLARGRQARDPHAKTIPYMVNSLDAFETSLREYLDHPPEHPEHTECQLSFWIGTSFLVGAPSPLHPPPPPPQPQQPQFVQHPDALHHHQPYGAPQYQSVADPALALALDFAPAPQPPPLPPASNGKKNEPKVAMSILEALQPTSDPKEKMRKQRAIAKCCVDTIQKCDGYRYSFHNCWNSREDDSFRFSYYCNDSLLNKDRAANGKGAKLGKRATKPVYDCKGVLSIKFSASKQSLDVFYRHVPVHKTYEERAPPPRKDSRRRKLLEEHDPTALKKIPERPNPPKPQSETPPTDAQKPKKKKKVEDPKSSTSLESDLRSQSLRSLLELIRPDPGLEPSLPEPPPLPPPPVSQHQHPPPQPFPQQQPQAPPPPQATTRRRPRNSCDVCKAKKTKCDGARPVCQTCSEKKRQCLYSADMGTEEQRPHLVPDPAESMRQAQAVTTQLSELELMKRELERMKKEHDDAIARIQELEDEKRRSSTTPAQVSQIAQVQKSSRPQAKHPPQSTDTPPSHHQHRHQHSRSHSHHQQQQPQQSQPQQQVQLQASQPQPSPQQALRQLQTAAQQLQTSQQPVQASQYTHFNPHSHTPNAYALNRSGMSTQPMPQNLSSQNTPAQPQPQQQQQQAHQMGSGGVVAEQSNAYTRGEFGAWPPANSYYGYQSAQQQQQQQQQQSQQHQQENQWAAQARSSGAFR